MDSMIGVTNGLLLTKIRRAVKFLESAEPMLIKARRAADAGLLNEEQLNNLKNVETVFVDTALLVDEGVKLINESGFAGDLLN